jgi:hypothetical protein
MGGHTRREILAGLAGTAAAMAQAKRGAAPMQHKVTNRESPAPEPGAETQIIPSWQD